MKLRAYILHHKKRFRWLKYYFSKTVALQCCFGIIVGTLLGSISLVVGVFWVGIVIGRRKYIWFFVLILFGGLHSYSRVGPALRMDIERLNGAQGEFRISLTQDSYMSGYQRAAIGVVDSLPGYIMARMPEYPAYVAGDIVTIKGTLSKPPVFENFDYAQFLASQEIYLQLDASEANFVGKESGLISMMSSVRNKTKEIISQSIPQPQSSLLQGLILGGRVEFGDELEKNLRNSGTSHIVAVSGYNVTSVLVILMLLAGLMPRRVLLLCCLLALLFFLYLVGPENLPARRAVYMGFLLVASMLSGRKSVLPLGLTYVIALMMLENPLVWRNISFQLSIAAMTGILLFSKSIRVLFKWAPDTFSEILASTLAVMLATIPISVGTFGSLSMVALPANLLVLPLVPVTMLLGMLGVLSVQVMPWLGSFILWLANLGLSSIIGMIEWFGRLPNASTDNAAVACMWIFIVAALYFIGDYISYEKSLE